jgi:hypothetical protein
MFAASEAARITYRIDVATSGDQLLELGLLPLFPSRGEEALLLEISIDHEPPRALKIERRVDTPAWAQGVLDNVLWIRASDALASGTHEVAVTARSSGVALDQLRLRPTVSGLR